MGYIYWVIDQRVELTSPKEPDGEILLLKISLTGLPGTLNVVSGTQLAASS